MDTSGFYKADESGKLLFAPNFVYAPKFSLTRKEKDEYIYPVEGWEWFDTEDLAKTKFGIETDLLDVKQAIEVFKQAVSLADKEAAVNSLDKVISEYEVAKLEIIKEGVIDA